MAFNAFISIKNIPGECSDSAHKDWIEVLDYNLEIKQPPTSSTGTGWFSGGRADFGELTFKKTVDGATPDIAIYCAKGTDVGTVELEICESAGDKHTVMKYTMDKAMISAVQVFGSSTGAETKPQEEVKLRYTKMMWSYTPMKDNEPQAAVERTYNVQEDVQE